MPVAFRFSLLGSSLMLVSNPTINFVVYDKVKQVIDNHAKSAGRKYLTSFEIFMTGTLNELNDWFLFCLPSCSHWVGAIAKALATILTYPIQVAQSRQRANKDKKGSM